MEQWEAVLESHQDPPDIREFSKMLQVAGNLMKLDLADFEIDWFLQTLLDKPISLLTTIRFKRSDDTWSKPVGDTFKLLAELVEKVPRRVEPYIEDIVEICGIPLDARTRVYALGCLTACVKRRAIDARKYIAALQDASACRAPMAVLVGAICEYHPEAISEDATNIWRIFLNLLDCNKNTDTVINAVLQGISGLFKHFGMDLPVVELSKFYQKLSRNYIKISRCENVVLSILEKYSMLFKQVLSRDSALRMYIWSPDCVRVAPYIYKTIVTELDREEMLKILTSEIMPQTTNYNASIKYTALRISCEIKKQYNIQMDMSDLDVYTLEFELRNEVSYHTSEAISYCIDCNLPNSEKVLQSAILFYENLPISKRKDIVVNGILKADNELMIATLNYIITESCQPDVLPSFLPLWEDILQSDLEGKMTFFINYVQNFIFVVDMFLEGDEKNIPEKLTTFLTLTSHVFTLTPPEDYTADRSALVSRKMAQLAAECGVVGPLVAVVRSLMAHLNGDEHLVDVFEMFEIERCKDETLLCEISLTLIHSPKKYNNFNRILLALEVIFSRKDAEPTTLARALEKFGDLIITTEPMADDRIHNILLLVEKLRNRKDLVGKDARILQRDVTIFLGKYSRNDGNNNDNFVSNFAIDLKQKLTLDIPNSYGDSFQINLSRQVILALEEENYEILNTLLCVICTNPSIQTEPYQKALGAIIARCSRGEDHAGVSHAQLYCGTYSMDYIIRLLTRSTPGPRKLLCDVIEGILLKDSRNSELISKVAEDVITLLSSSILTHRQAGLDLLQSLLQPLKENNEVTKKILLKLLILVSTTNESDTFILIDESQKLLKEKIELFESDTLNTTLIILVQNLLKISKKNYIAHKNYTNLVKSAIELVKTVCDSKSLDIWAVIGTLFDSCQSVIDSDRYLIVTAVLAGKFVELVSNEFFEMNNGFLERMLFDCQGDLNEFQLENVLMFLNTFHSVLLEFHRQRLKDYLNNLIKDIKPKQVIYLRKKLHIVISQYSDIINVNSLVIWLEKQPLDVVTSDLEKNQIGGHFENLTAVRILLQMFDVRDAAVSLTFLNGFAQKWPRIILRMYAAGFLKYLTVGMSFLTDLLTVSLRFLTVSDFKKLVFEGHNLRGVRNEKLGLEFCKLFIGVFFEYFLRKPFVLFDEDMSECVVILNDVVRIVVRLRAEKYYDDLFELIEGIWPKYAVRTEFAQKQKLLQDLAFLSKKLSAKSKPIQWAMSIIIDENIDINEKVLLIGVLPGGEDCSEIYIKYASALPTRLSELRGTNHTLLRSILDATALHSDTTLLDIVIAQAAGDPSSGWWETGFSSCMASIAISSHVDTVYDIVYSRLWEGISVSVCLRLMVPLIRYSTPTTVTTFISGKIQELCNKLRHQTSPANHYKYNKYVADCVRVLSIFMAVMEKIPPQHIESPSSPLYSHIQTDKSWHLVRELCKLSLTHRSKVQTPDGASQELVDLCRTFQTTAYNCLCACLTTWKPDEKLYKTTIFVLNALEKVSNSNEEYNLPIRAQWNTTSISMSTSVRSSSTCTSARTRLFLRTLSENPLLYDLIDDFEEEQVETQQISVPSTELNTHPCAPTLTSLILHFVERNFNAWLQDVDIVLKEGSRNCRWLLAQAICNTKEELKRFSVSLAPGLLCTVADTAVESGEKKLLNGLHVDIINTLILWGDIPNPNLTHTNTCTEYLIHTCVSNRDKKSVFRNLLDVLNKFLDLFGKYITLKWSVFENYFDDPAITKSTVPILIKVSKSNINIPELLPNLLSKLSNYHDNQLAKLSELLGLVIRNDNSRPNIAVKKLFEKIRKSSLNDYVKLVYYSKYCDEQQFRVIVDLAQKLPPSEKKKCIDILYTYLEQQPDSELMEEMPSELKSLIDEKSSGKRFEDFFNHPTSESLSKRPRYRTPSIILNTIGNNERYFNKLLNELEATKRGQLVEKLSQDMGVRLVECFYISIYLPVIYPNNKLLDLSVCLTSFYEMLFSQLKSDERFKQAKLTETSIELEKGQLSKILTRTKTYIGSLRSYSYTKSRKNAKKETKTGFGSEIFVENILNTLLQFAKVSIDCSMDLLKQLFISIKSNEFDSLPVMAEMLSKIISKETAFLEFSRIFAQNLCEIDNIFDTMKELKTKTLGTDVEFMVKILYEDLKLLKFGPEQFILGNSIKDDIYDVSMRDESEQFSIEELVSAFQKLSNWDDLTFQERRTIENTGIPILWTNREHFDELIQDYTETETWFGKMVSLNMNRKQDSLKWLREAVRPPRRYFYISAITEAIQWQDNRQTNYYAFRLNNEDCLIEWAARLMLRSCYLSRSSSDRDESIHLSRSHELVWCQRATEMALPRLALQCVKRNTGDLYVDETLLWLEQKVDALKVMGIKENDSQLLRKALDTAENYTPLFKENSTPESILKMNSLITDLSYKLELLDSAKLNTLSSDIDVQFNQLEQKSMSFEAKKRLLDFYSTSILFYDDLWEENTDKSLHNTYLKSMLPIIQRSIDLNLDLKEGFLSIFFNKLESFDHLATDFADSLKVMIKSLLKTKQTQFLHLLKTKLQSYPLGLNVQEVAVRKYTTCLQLVADPDFTLLRYCTELSIAVRNGNINQFKKLFTRMKVKIFENPYLGTDYQTLLKYKTQLYGIQDVSMSDSAKIQTLLKSIVTELQDKRPIPSLRLSQLCPALTDFDENNGLKELLGLNEDVVKFDEQIQVFIDSIGRPCVLTAILKNGGRARFLVKQADMWQAAAALTVAGSYPVAYEGYRIIPLSEDCGLIQFLENHVRIRELISNNFDIKDIPIIRQSTKEDELILPPIQTSVVHFNQICIKMPPYILRSAIEDKCQSVQDFIFKKNKYLNTLCTMIVFNYIFGLGDRHLENILYDTQNGGLQCIDLDALFQYGVCELPPARLTRNILSLIDSKVLESRLQTKMAAMRECQRYLTAIMDFCFQNDDQDFIEKLPYIKAILKGTKLSHEITKEVMKNSDKKYKEKYIQLLDEIFKDFDVKNQYNIEEQVSNLLLHCTDPRILSVVRSGWEPWL